MWEEDKNRFFESFLVCKQATTIPVLFKNGSEKGSTSVFSYSLYNKLSIEYTFTVNTAETFVQEQITKKKPFLNLKLTILCLAQIKYFEKVPEVQTSNFPCI